MLTNIQITDLAKRLDIPLERVCFKDELHEEPLKFNRGYIINLENSVDKDGNNNPGTHWTALYVRKYTNNLMEPVFFDSFGAPPSKEIIKYVNKYTNNTYLVYSSKDIQSLMNNACGWYSLSFLYFISSPSFKYREPNSLLYDQVGHYLDIFNDLNISCDYKKNEYMLRMFFQSKDPKLRKEIDVISNPSNIINQDDHIKL